MTLSAIAAALTLAAPPAAPRSVAACLRDAACRPRYVVAHRASCGGAPENSRAGVTCAVESGIPLIETDVRRSADGSLFMLHDPKLERTTSGSGPIAEQTAAQLAAVKLANGESLPRFEDLYLRSRGRAVLVLDMKVDAVEQVAAVLAARGSFDDVVFFVSDAATAATARRLKAEHPGMLVMADRPEWALQGAAELVQADMPSYEQVEALREKGVKVMASLEMVDNLPGFRRLVAEVLLKRRVDCILTNEPVWLKSTLTP